jgi:hypothetical protein
VKEPPDDRNGGQLTSCRLAAQTRRGAVGKAAHRPQGHMADDAHPIAPIALQACRVMSRGVADSA